MEKHVLQQCIHMCIKNYRIFREFLADRVLSILPLRINVLLSFCPDPFNCSKIVYQNNQMLNIIKILTTNGKQPSSIFMRNASKHSNKIHSQWQLLFYLYYIYVCEPRFLALLFHSLSLLYFFRSFSISCLYIKVIHTKQATHSSSHSQTIISFITILGTFKHCQGTFIPC